MKPVHLPHETSTLAQVFTCWPASVDLWEEDLYPAQAEFGAFLSAMVSDGPARLPLTILAATAQAEASARRALGAQAEIVRSPYGDVWTRDTGPVFLRENGRLIAVRFRFNGWGGKYEFPADRGVSAKLAGLAGAELRDVDLVAEGGALEFDGDGTLITTRQCLLNPNRNPGLNEAQVEARLMAALGVKKILWIDEGLAGDHTDGHIDNIVRFARPGVVVCQKPFGEDDPQARILTAISRQLSRMSDARGRRLQVHHIPSPGRVETEDGEIMPASYMNWVIGPKNLVVPTYGRPGEGAALRGVQAAFPDHRIVGRASGAILTGGGAFHCVTCHVPGD